MKTWQFKKRTIPCKVATDTKKSVGVGFALRPAAALFLRGTMMAHGVVGARHYGGSEHDAAADERRGRHGLGEDEPRPAGGKLRR